MLGKGACLALRLGRDEREGERRRRKTLGEEREGERSGTVEERERIARSPENDERKRKNLNILAGMAN